MKSSQPTSNRLGTNRVGAAAANPSSGDPPNAGGVSSGHNRQPSTTANNPGEQQTGRGLDATKVGNAVTTGKDQQAATVPAKSGKVLANMGISGIKTDPARGANNVSASPLSNGTSTIPQGFGNGQQAQNSQNEDSPAKPLLNNTGIANINNKVPLNTSNDAQQIPSLGSRTGITSQVKPGINVSPTGADGGQTSKFKVSPAAATSQEFGRQMNKNGKKAFFGEDFTNGKGLTAGGPINTDSPNIKVMRQGGGRRRDKTNEDAQSLRSSFDYVDVDMKDAMDFLTQRDLKSSIKKKPNLQSRFSLDSKQKNLSPGGRAFFKKEFKEGDWSGDESVFEKQIKMPNVQNNRQDYMKEIGLNIDVHTEPKLSQKTEERQDTLKEARSMLPERPFYKITKKDRLQIIDDYTDRCPLLELRKTLMRWRVYIQRGSQMVVMHSLFESISITVIVVNSLFLAMDDPLRDPSETPAFMNVADDIFQYMYTIEMVFKILSMGFILNPGSYLRDAWNILDFTIIASGYLSMFMAGSGANLSVLRSFRVIRPLRTISSIQGLRVIVSSLINAIPLLRDSILVLMFFFLIFAIAGTQLFAGALKNRCFNEDTGLIDDGVEFCGGQESCRPGYYCGKSNENPANGATNFDNVMFSLMQVFQVVTLEGWTGIMVPLEQSVGTWIIMYFYPIVFIGAFFLLNLTLAVIKAKFTEEMNNKKEAAKPKKKKIDDAPESSEDEDLRANELQDQIDHIKKSKQMSPRTKEMKLNKMKIEHMIWRIDTAFEQQDVFHKVVERTEEDEKRTPGYLQRNTGGPSKSYFGSAVEKIGILKPSMKQLSYAAPKGLNKSKVQPAINYSDVFYSDKATVLHIGKSPRENLRDIFSNDTRGALPGGQIKKIAGVRPGSPIHEDEEEQDLAGLLDGEGVDRAEALRRREQRRKPNSKRPSSGGRMGALEGEHSSNPTADAKKPFGMSRWLGQMFEAKKEDGGANNGSGASGAKKLVFAGIKNNNVRPVGVPMQRQQSLPQEYEEHVKRQVYENLTRNFDIFEFLDEHAVNGSRVNGVENATNNPIGGQDGDDELSDDLEFQIDGDDHRFESLYFDSNNLDNRRAPEARTGNAILDLDDDDDLNGSGRIRDPLKRGSTQATAAENGMVQKNSGETDARYISPFMQSLLRQNSGTPKDPQAAKKQRVAAKLQKLPDLVYKGGERGLLNLFRGCKKITAVNSGRDFKEEYLLLRKRARSQELKKGQKPLKEFKHETYRFEDDDLKKQAFKEFEDNQKMTVRAKSLESKRKRLLAESVRFQRRIDIMRKRRAQFFAPSIKMLGVNREDAIHMYEEYVKNKRRIKVHPTLMAEAVIPKTVLFRSASSEALIRHKDVAIFQATQPLRHHKKSALKGQYQMDLRYIKAKNQGEDVSLQLDSQRSVFLDDQFADIVEKAQLREVDINRRRDIDFVPDMYGILQDQEIKIVVKMTNQKYTSINDIFEKSGPGRFLTDKEKARLEREEQKRQALKMKLPVRIPPREMIVGYQKKIFVGQKSFHEDLLKNEFQESDEDQDGMLGRIEGEYNSDHRSHIYVTGTVSVTVNKPHTDNKIMNANYHKNIRIMNEVLELEEKERREMMEREAESIKSGKKNGKTNKTAPATGLDSSAWKKISAMNLSQNASVASMIRGGRSSRGVSLSAKRSRNGSIAESLMGRSKKNMPPKPEPLTDKQILRRLNEEVQRSQIFKQLNIRKLPERIIRRQEVDKNLFKKKKKKGVPGAKQEEEPLADEGSAGEENEAVMVRKQRKFDYFLDRPVDGSFHIQLARKAAFKRHKDFIEWSGQDIMPRLDPYKARIAVSKLDSIRVWPYAIHGFVKKRRVLLKSFMNSPVVEHGMTLCVLGNTVVLSLDFYGASQGIQDFCALANTFFTLIFAAEMGLRITAIGASKWLADKMNYMDGTIVILSLVELIFMSGSGALSALRAVRIFRVFRVLRVARLLRGLKSMVQIINVISRSISSFIYLAMLLMLFIFIYALLGMQVFGGAFTDPEVVGTVRYNYDSFNNAFITSFILLTTENWNTVLFYAFTSTVPQFVIYIYFVSCIFVGNWMLLNLFLAILLDSFTAVEEEDMMTPEKKEAIKQKMIEDLKMKEGEDFIEGMDELQKEAFVLKADKSKKKKKKKKGKKKDEIVKSQASAKAPTQANILNESQEVDLYELAKRDQELLEQRKQLFRGIECERSFYLLSKQNWIRIGAYKTINHGKFETFIMILIVGSSFKLVFDTYTSKLDSTDPVVVYSDYFDLAFQIFFTCEMCLKIVAFGFVMDENSYLTEAWNKLDCFIVVSGLIDTFMAGVDIPVIKVLRLLRILRPLRFVSHSSSMKTLIEALMASMGSIMNVGVVIIVVFLMFAILGVNLFAGKLQSCSVDFYKINNLEECFEARGDWTTYVQNMDNVVKAMLTLFVVSNNEGWPDVMYAYCDATGVETGPKPGAGILNAYFFVFFVFVGSFFFMNLFVGVLFLNFEKAQRDEKDAMLLDGEEVQWVDMMKMICQEKPEIVKIPNNAVSKWCYQFVIDGGPFANFIMTCIILNIFTMAAIFEGQSDAYSAILEKVNYFFTAAFALEATVKLIANGGAYFSSAWNKFDFFVVSASFLDIVMANMSANSLKVIRVGPQLARIMRVMRVSRLFKLLNKYKGLQALMQTITFSMPSVINAFALLALVYFIFSVLGVFFFKDIISGDQLDPDYMNFSTFSFSLVMMLRLSTGEDWPAVMYDCMNTDDDCIPEYNCGTDYAPVFYLAFVLVQQYIMVNLFILIILQQFDLYYLPDDNVLDRFKADVTQFKIVWKLFSSEKYEGYKIAGTDVQKFFKKLKGDLGMANEKDQKTIERNLVIMNIQADDEGFIYFNELLYKTMKRRYAPGRTVKKVLFEMELQTLEKLEKISKQQIFESRKKERVKAVAVNPFLAMMYKSMSFNVWKDIYEANVEARNHRINLQLERQISEDEEEEEEQGSVYEYETEEDDVIDEYDKEYIEYLANVEAERADPFGGEGSANGTVHPPSRHSRIAGQNQYDQLKQEDEILGAPGITKLDLSKLH